MRFESLSAYDAHGKRPDIISIMCRSRQTWSSFVKTQPSHKAKHHSAGVQLFQRMIRVGILIHVHWTSWLPLEYLGSIWRLSEQPCIAMEPVRDNTRVFCHHVLMFFEIAQ